MGGLDLSDLAVIVSVKIDTPDRLANLDRLAGYYAHVGEGAEIIVVEQGDAPRVAPNPDQGVTTVFIRDTGCHWKTRNMNHGARLSMRRLLLLSDCDTVPHPDALAEGLGRIAGGADLVSLYNGVSVNVSKRLAASIASWEDFFARTRSLDPAEIDSDSPFGEADQAPLYGNARYRAVGGCFLARRAAFFGAGGWNENFVSYGFEDMEFDARIRLLGLKVARTEGHSLFHFAHDRGWDSRYSTFYRLNKEEYERVAAMTPEELRGYVDRGFRAMNFDHEHEYLRESAPDREIWRKIRPERVDLSDLTVLVIADARQVGYDQSCLEPFADYLEAHFWNFDLRLCEISGTHYKHIRAKKNLDYRTWQEGDDAALREAVIGEAARRYVYELRLGADAGAQLARVISVFDRLRGGIPPEAIFERRGGRAGE